jgi:uncharacterized protein YecT (DUF1311 family)
MRRLTLAVATSATVLLVSAADGGATSAHGAALKPPVIHETFTPLPCGGTPTNRTTVQQEGCAEQQILRTDITINSLNKAIFAKLPGDATRRRFIAAHRAWLRYRHAYCLSLSDVFQGGSQAPVLDAQCAGRLNGQHIKDLRQFAGDVGAR